MFENAEVGDLVTRVFPCTKNDEGKVVFPEGEFDGRIIEVGKETVTALIRVDIPRSLQFRKGDGVCTEGSAFGRLIPAKWPPKLES